jgi:phosphopantothenoylcysteine decarboxylase / phosphopantothenate---cysteine ligase
VKLNLLHSSFVLILRESYLKGFIIMNSSKRNIILGISGSTAATKSQSIALALRHVGFNVRVAMTHSSQRIVGLTALQSVIEEAPYCDLWTNPGGVGGEVHIQWADWADAMVVAPATASCIASLYLGQFDSPVTLIAGAMDPKKIFLAPAMASEMWNWPSVQRNVAELSKWGVRFLGPIEGQVASGHSGMRLMEPRDIAQALDVQCLKDPSL